jgi:hypothetical protein
MNKITCGRWLHNATTEEFTKYVANLDFDQYYIDKYETAVAACNPEVIYMEYSTKNDLNYKGYKVKDAYSSAVHFVEDEYRDMLDSIQNKTIFDESELLAMINGDDAVTITPEVYSQLVKMFESSDQDNHIMAMEIMANSNYIDSALYLLLLLEGYAHKIGDCHTRNHVNFKSMVSYFTLAVKEIGWLDPDKIAKKLVTLDLLTKDWTHVLLQERVEWFIRNIAHSTTFNVSEIVPTPEIQIAINDSYSGNIEYKPNTKEVASVTEFSILPEREIESEEEERVAVPEMEAIFTEEEDVVIGEVIAELDIEDTEVTLETELLSNNHQIETNESTDIDWF